MALIVRAQGNLMIYSLCYDWSMGKEGYNPQVQDTYNVYQHVHAMNNMCGSNVCYIIGTITSIYCYKYSIIYWAWSVHSHNFGDTHYTLLLRWVCAS